jgi:hypothetical protein
LSSKEFKFKIQSSPPNNSKQIWSDPTQSCSLISLRKAAFLAKISESIDNYNCDIGLEIDIFGRKEDLDVIGDLDNLLGGVCDGLASRPQNPTVKKSAWYDFEDDKDFGPDIPLLYNDDKIIKSMRVSISEVDEELYYTVKIFPL